jgi:hypothetical protein
MDQKAHDFTELKDEELDRRTPGKASVATVFPVSALGCKSDANPKS